MTLHLIKAFSDYKLNSIVHFICIASISLMSCNSHQHKEPEISVDIANEKSSINQLLDSFNLAAANANFEKYFQYYAEDAIFTGTDATERWDKTEFMAYSKPHFDKGKAWNFTSLDRHIYFDTTGKVAWFDELLSTQMKICRGSGVLQKHDNEWKIEQYILSITMPNDSMDVALGLKGLIEDKLMEEKYEFVRK